jgi:hypothetical protein
VKYNVEEKRQWRFWVWKRIKQYCGVPSHSATVLFLSGPSPLDLEAADKYGFKRRNIVAIDTDLASVRSARKDGCRSAIQGDLHEIAMSWNDGPIHGIVADYCGGMSWDVAMKSRQLARVATATCFNFQRGRESDGLSSRFRERLLQGGVETKHRGEQFRLFLAMFDEMTLRTKKSHPDSDLHRVWNLPRIGDHPVTMSTPITSKEGARRLMNMSDEVACNYLLPPNARRVQEILEKYLQSEVYTYRSNRVLMDTIVGTMQGTMQLTGGWQNAMSSSVGYYKTLPGTAKLRTTGQRLAAAKAIRTMNGAVRLQSGNN